VYLAHDLTNDGEVAPKVFSEWLTGKLSGLRAPAVRLWIGRIGRSHIVHAHVADALSCCPLCCSLRPAWSDISRRWTSAGGGAVLWISDYGISTCVVMPDGKMSATEGESNRLISVRSVVQLYPGPFCIQRPRQDFCFWRGLLLPPALAAVTRALGDHEDPCARAYREGPRADRLNRSWRWFRCEWCGGKSRDPNGHPDCKAGPGVRMW
jgi:hypothetical protein